MELLHKELTDKILKSFFVVYNELQYGFLENIYEKAMLMELSETGLHVERQKQIEVFYKGRILGHYVTDLIIEEKVILELKAQPAIMETHEAQLLHYLRATTYEVGLLLNFGNKPEFRRKVFANERKRFSSH